MEIDIVQEREKLASAIQTIKRHRLLFAVGLLVFAVVIVAFLYQTGAGEKLVARDFMSIAADSQIKTFNYSGTGVNQSMALGCNLPASMKITCQNLVKTGTINVYINEENYATGTVTGSGEVMLSSGCGCSTVCICEIKVGENTIKISSDSFQGQLKYEIYVK